MSKSNEELEELKKEVEAVNGKVRELTSEELEQVVGGLGFGSEEWGEMIPADICNQVLRDQCLNAACPCLEVLGGGINFICHKYKIQAIIAAKG